jgi:hypothetical protein
MKNLKKTSLFLLMIGSVLAGCRKEVNEPEDVIIAPPKEEIVELSGNITTRTLEATKKYLLKGQVFIQDGQTITVQPGTIILGEKRTKGTLIVNRGGKLIANGTVDKPIVMTSNQLPGDRDRGDWGGLVILGRASCNQVDPAIEGIDPAVFFGANPGNSSSDKVAVENDNSGTYRYLRVEFAGIELSPNNETNSITMGGVGRGTIMEYCQVSYGGDDGFEWFGGTVNGKYFISHASWDDCFDVDFGWSGNVQFGVAIRYPSYADQSGSNTFECDNGPNDNDVQPYTTGTFSNITGIGPIRGGTSISNGNFQHSLDLRRRTAVSILNSVFTGFPRGIRFNQASVLAQYTANRGVLANNILICPTVATTYQAGTGVNVGDVSAYWLAANTTVSGAYTDAQYTALGINPDLIFGTRLDTAYPANPAFAVTSGTIATGAAFTNPKFTEANRTGFFTTVTYRGAFGASDWTDNWAEFRPVDKTY